MKHYPGMSSPKPEPKADSPEAGLFATTHWSVVARAGDSQSPESGLALERLCSAYWYPVYVFVRKRGHGHEDASDLTQSFFERFLAKRYLKDVDANLGKFRTFLLTSLTHFLANEWDKSRAQRRGGGVKAISMDELAAEQRYRCEPVDYGSPERIFEQRWAQTLLGVVLERLAKETSEDRFEVLKEFLLGDKAEVSYDEAAARLGITTSAVTSAIHRMRARYKALLFEEVAQTVEKPEDVEQEIRQLFSALAE